MKKESEEVALAAELSGGPPPRFECGRRHSHKNEAKVTECDDRLAGRARLKVEAAVRREREARSTIRVIAHERRAGSGIGWG
jgi:hypothetical protein